MTPDSRTLSMDRRVEHPTFVRWVAFARRVAGGMKSLPALSELTIDLSLLLLENHQLQEKCRLQFMTLSISPRCLEAVRDARDFDSLKEYAQTVVEELGFEGFMYVMVWREDVLVADPKTFVLGTYDPGYMTMYQENQWFRADPAASYILRDHLPMVWRRADFASPEAARIFAAANRYGLGTGAIFPVVSSNVSIAGLGIARDGDPDANHERTVHMLPYGQLLSIYLHAAVSRLLKLQPAPAVKEISQRERECLQLAAQGMRDADIARALNITPRTVISHLSSARRKLESDNRSQMIARAMALKVIGL